MAMVLVVAFNDKEKADFDELLLFLKKKKHIKLNTFSNKEEIEFDNFVMDSKYRMVEVEGKNIKLTNYEFEILYLLARSPGQVFSKEQIYNQVWNAPYYGAEDNVMSLIRRIRKKIEPDPSKPVYILTVWGMGYKFNNQLKRK